MKITSLRSITLAAGVFMFATMSSANALVDNSQPPTAAFCSGACGVGSAIGFSRTVSQGAPAEVTSFTDIWEFTVSEAVNINGFLFSNNTLNTFRLLDANVSLQDGLGTPVDPVGGFTVPNPPPFNSVLETAVAFANLGAGDYRFVLTGLVPSDQVAGQYEFQGELSAVPLPAAGWLLLSAIVGLLSVSRRGRMLARAG